MIKRYLKFPATWWHFFAMLQRLRASGEYTGGRIGAVRSSFRLAIAYTA